MNKTVFFMGYRNENLRYHFQIFRTYSIEPGVCDESGEINSA